MKNNFFDQFPTITDKEWKLKVQTELKGLEYNQTLVWGTRDEINVKPLYTKNDIDYENIQPLPRTAKDWKIISTYNNDAKQDSSFLYGYVIDSQTTIDSKLPNYLDLFVSLPANEQADLGALTSLENLTYLDYDPFGYLAQNGMWPDDSKQSSLDKLRKIAIIDKFEKNISIQADVYQNAGANHLQQIAIAAAHAVEYIEFLGKEIIPKIYFKFAVGSNFFFEIAKLRAFRFLWKLITDKYEVDENAFLFVENSKRNKSTLDIYNNIIRSSLEANSAILGGADAINIHAYNDLENASAFGDEIAAKQQLLLKKESFMDQFTDPVAGSYFIESLTNQFVEKSLETFKTIQLYGGFINALENETIQDMIYTSDKKEKSDFAEGKLSLIGVNKYPNPNDVKKIKSQERIIRDALFVPIIPTRLAEKLENQ
ncbi:methylmalonyl-CoA mutase family protein [Vaginella massiliensis]|uniref:methylmalonyl-CoA mutase family protein n=1 Tax=Vaginella massiliensis TaxID=1816680 RepID=UPI003751E8A5